MPIDPNTGLASIADKDAIQAYTLDLFVKKLRENKIKYIIAEDNASQQEIMELAKKECPNKDVIIIYDCTAIMNQYKAWNNSGLPIQFFYGSSY